MTKRRTKGEGSITQLPNGHFKVRIETTPVNGKRKWLSATVETKRQALVKLRELESQKEDNKYHSEPQEDINTYKERYLTFKTNAGLRETTLYSIRLVLSKLVDYFGRIPITLLDKDKVMEFVNDLRKNGGLSHNTLKNYLNRLMGFFEWLEKRKVTPCNLMEDITIPRGKKNVKAHLEVLSEEEHQRLKAAMLNKYNLFKTQQKTPMSYRMYVIYLIAYETGLRAGEIMGLKWEHVDFDECTIDVVNAISNKHDGRGYTDGDPKSDNGFRKIHLSKDTADVLKDLKETYKSQGYTSVYVFPSRKTKNKPYCSSKMSDLFSDYQEMIGLNRHLTFHDLRHTNASIMIAKGVNIGVITERLGHSSIAVTYNTYAHILQDCEDRNKAVVIA